MFAFNFATCGLSLCRHLWRNLYYSDQQELIEDLYNVIWTLVLFGFGLAIDRPTGILTSVVQPGSTRYVRVSP